MRGRLVTQCTGNYFQHAIHIPHYIIVPKSKHSVVALAQPFVTQPIPRIIRVLAAVNFNDQPFLSTDKINNKTANRLLSNKLATVNASCAQKIPKT